jgi:hypothetical protein
MQKLVYFGLKLALRHNNSFKMSFSRAFGFGENSGFMIFGRTGFKNCRFETNPLVIKYKKRRPGGKKKRQDQAYTTAILPRVGPCMLRGMLLCKEAKWAVFSRGNSGWRTFLSRHRREPASGFLGIRPPFE